MDLVPAVVAEFLLRLAQIFRAAATAPYAAIAEAAGRPRLAHESAPRRLACITVTGRDVAVAVLAELVASVCVRRQRGRLARREARVPALILLAVLLLRRVEGRVGLRQLEPHVELVDVLLVLRDLVVEVLEVVGARVLDRDEPGLLGGDVGLDLVYLG